MKIYRSNYYVYFKNYIFKIQKNSRLVFETKDSVITFEFLTIFCPYFIYKKAFFLFEDFFYF